MVSQGRLKELLYYNPQFGIFVRRKGRKGGARQGDIAGCLQNNGYIKIVIDFQDFLAHRLAFLYMDGEFPPNDVDHINGCRSDNSWANLRSATRLENMRNKRLLDSNKSGVTGVSWNKRSKKWRAQITVNYQVIYIGHFRDMADAIKARKRAEIEHGFHPNHGRRG